MIDLRDAINCLWVKAENKTYRGEKIGIIRGDSDGYKRGQVVLFTPQFYHSDEHPSKANQPTGRITIETPMTTEEIARQREKASALTTIYHTINVPASYVEEVALP